MRVGRSWTRRAVVLGVIFLLLAGITLGLGMNPSLLMLAGLVAGLGVALFAVSDLQLVSAGVDWTGSWTSPGRQFGADYRVNYLRRRVEEATARGGHASDSGALAAALYPLAAERLREVHGIDLAREPRRAAGVLGQDVVDYLTQTRQPGRVSTAFLTGIVDQLEAM